MGVTVLTKSKQWTCESSKAQQDLAADQPRTAVTHVEWRGTRMEHMLLADDWVVLASKPLVVSFADLGLKTWAEVPTRNG